MRTAKGVSRCCSCCCELVATAPPAAVSIHITSSWIATFVPHHRQKPALHGTICQCHSDSLNTLSAAPPSHVPALKLSAPRLLTCHVPCAVACVVPCLCFLLLLGQFEGLDLLNCLITPVFVSRYAITGDLV